MRQMGSGTALENTKSYKSVDRDTPSSNMPKTAVSQSAPHTPVSVPNHCEGQVLRSVPRLLSEPMVSSQTRSSSPGVRSLDNKSCKSDRVSPYFQEKRADAVEGQFNGIEGLRGLKVPPDRAPVHSPKTKKESKFSLKSPHCKQETRGRMMENRKASSVDLIHDGGILGTAAKV